MDKTKLDAHPTGTAFIIAAVVIYQDLTTMPTNWVANIQSTTKTTPVAIMEAQAPLIDMAPIVAIVE